jgi:hypothetical protein
MQKIPMWAVAFVRASLAALWAFEGLWLKVIVQDPHELGIVSNAASRLGLPGRPTMIAIGLAEGVLAIVVLLGWKMRLVAYVQGGALVTMNFLGILLGEGEIKAPVSLLIHNLPTFACIALLGALGGVDRAGSRA